jgi:hypothetical protein
MSSEIDRLFDYHRPTPEQQRQYERITAAVKALAELLHEECPASPDRDAAVNKLREVRMLANASIACAPPAATKLFPCPTCAQRLAGSIGPLICQACIAEGGAFHHPGDPRLHVDVSTDSESYTVQREWSCAEPKCVEARAENDTQRRLRMQHRLKVLKTRRSLGEDVSEEDVNEAQRELDELIQRQEGE